MKFWRLLITAPLLCAIFLRALPAEASDVSVTRAQFLREAVHTLYGEAIRPYPAPITGVPKRIEHEVGLALTLDAIPEWRQSSDWRAPVTRGQALTVLLRLADIQVLYSGKTGYQDLHGETAIGIAKQAEALQLLGPLTPRAFGWGRALTSPDLEHALDALTRHLDLPLAQPPATGPAPQKPQTRAPRKKEIRITIKPPVLSRGQESISKDFPKQDLLSTIWGLLQERYLRRDRLSDEEIAYGLAEYLMKSIDDPYAAFLRPKPAKDFQQHLEGEITGIGAQVELHPMGGVRVVSPLTESPAMKAGLLPGDRVTHVDGQSILELDLQQAVDLIRGPVGTSVTLKVERGGGSLMITIARARIAIPELDLSHQSGVLVVKLFQFGERTIRELGSLLEEGMEKDPEGIVLDVRNNPGGLLDAAIDVLSHFLPKGTVVAKIKTKEDLREEHIRGSGPVVPMELPMVVLVNRGSASASEIVAGAIQDLKRAQIVGTQTFGKGSVQEVMQFKTGESVKFTIAEWLTPNGRSIEGTGITPDVLLEELPEGRDELLLEAIRRVKNAARGY